MFSPFHRVVLDHDLDSDDDIRRYLVGEFSRISMERGLASHVWPPEGAGARSSGSGFFSTVHLRGDCSQVCRGQIGIPMQSARNHLRNSPSNQ